MERITRFRAGIVLLLFVALIGFYVYRLYDEQIIKTDGGSISNETTFTTLTRVKPPGVKFWTGTATFW